MNHHKASPDDFNRLFSLGESDCGAELKSDSPPEKNVELPRGRGQWIEQTEPKIVLHRVQILRDSRSASLPSSPVNLMEAIEKYKQEFGRLLGNLTHVQFAGQGNPSKRLPELSEQEIKDRFGILLQEWMQDTEMSSNQVAIHTHPAYYGIIAMGRAALPLIFEDLNAGGGPWFVALKAITNEDPVAPAHLNDARLIREDWLAWGRAHDYL